MAVSDLGGFSQRLHARVSPQIPQERGFFPLLQISLDDFRVWVSLRQTSKQCQCCHSLRWEARCLCLIHPLTMKKKVASKLPGRCFRNQNLAKSKRYCDGPNCWTNNSKRALRKDKIDQGFKIRPLLI